MQCIRVQVPEETAAGYQTPGQYVQMRSGDDAKPGFFAMASSPGSGDEFEFLIKEKEAAKWLTDIKVGETLQMSQVMGGGFKIKQSFDSLDYDFPCLQVVMFAIGSGIAPIRAAIEQKGDGLRLADGRKAVLYYGARTPEQMAYQDKFDEWAKLGVEVVPVMSQPDASWKGASGYVQDVAKAAGIERPRNTGVLLCGNKEMSIDVKALCAEAGVFEGRVLTNF